MVRRKKSTRKVAKKRTTTRRRNPNPSPATKTRRRRSTKKVTRSRRRRRNPGGLSVSLPVLGKINLVDVGGGTIGSILAKMLPTYAAAKFGLPVTGLVKYPVQLASGLAVSWFASNILKQKGIGQFTALFTLNNVLTDLLTEFVVNPAGMGGLLGYPYTVLDPSGMSGIVQTGDMGPNVLFQPVPDTRDYVVNDVPERMRARF